MTKLREAILFYSAICAGVGGIGVIFQLFGVQFNVRGIVMPSHWVLAVTSIVLYLATLLGMMYFKRKADLRLRERAVITASHLHEVADLNVKHARDLETAKALLPLGETKTKVETVYTLDFKYLPTSPLEKGWTQPYNADGVAEFGTDPDIPESLRIKVTKSEIAIHFVLPVHATLVDHVEFTAKYTDRTMIFTRLIVSARDGSNPREVDIKYYYGETRALPTTPPVSADPKFRLPEHTVYFPAQVLSGGRMAFNIDLVDVVKLALGNQGWIYKSIVAVRLRGNLSISPLVFGKTA